MFTFYGWTLDELHTVCTLAGQGIKRMETEKAAMKAVGRANTVRYIEKCIEDAEALQQNAVNALEAKG